MGKQQNKRKASLGNLADELIRKEERLVEGISNTASLDFVESNSGLGVTLYPVQGLIFKCSFGIPLDYKEQMVPMWDQRKTKLIRTVTEREFLRILYEEGRTNIADWRDVPSCGFGTNIIFAGRRAGKSQLISAMGCTCLRNLLNIYNPQEYYDLVHGSDISFTLIGTDEDSSTRLYDKIKADIIRSPFFAPYMMNQTPNATTTAFYTQADKDRREFNPSIHVSAFPCTTRSVRGPSSYFLALDEFQHFRSTKEASSEDLYKAATPSTSQFAPKINPEKSDSKIACISSPLNKLGKMYDLSRTAMAKGVASDIFFIQLSTVEMNPRIPASKLEEDYQNNPESFKAEFGGEFLDGSGSFVPHEKFDVCISDRKNLQQFSQTAISRKFFWGIDLGMRGDGTALAISHLELVENRGVVLVYDYIDRMLVGERFEGIGVKNPEVIMTLKELQIMDIIAWFKAMNQFLPCFKGMIDQYSGTTLKQLLHLNEIPNVELVHITADINSKMYYSLKGFIDNGCVDFPDVPKFKQEFKQLEATYRSKYVLSVSAPEEKGAHDDLCDSVAESALLAQQWLDEFGKLDKDPSGSSLLVNPHNLGERRSTFIDPNNIDMASLKVLDRQGKIGVHSNLPPNIQVLPPMNLNRGGGRRRW